MSCAAAIEVSYSVSSARYFTISDLCNSCHGVDDHRDGPIGSAAGKWPLLDLRRDSLRKPAIAVVSDYAG